MGSRHKNEKGMTLIEVVIALAIVGVVVLMVFSMFAFGYRSYAKGGSRSEAQSDVSLAAQHITREVRYSSQVEILNASATIPAAVTNDDCYIFTGISGGKQSVLFRDKNGDRVITSGISGELLFDIGTSGNTLYFKIKGTNEHEVFDIDSEVYVMNLPGNLTITDNTGGADGTAIRFTRALVAGVSGLRIANPTVSGTEGQYYYHAFVVENGTAPYVFSIDGGSLPAGLSLIDDVNGIIAGTPEAGTAGVYTFSILLADSSQPQKIASMSYNIYIFDPDYGAAEQAAAITSIDNPLLSHTSLILPEVEPGYTIEIESSSDTGVIAGNGDITFPSVDTEVVIVLRITNIFNAIDTAVTVDITVTVPSLSGNAAPVASNVSITGSAIVGNIITGSYDYSDADSDAEGLSILKWYRCASEDGVGKTEVGSGSTYTVGAADLNNYLFFEVTPEALAGTTPGAAVLSAPTEKVTTNTEPEARNVYISGFQNGQTKPGDTLTGNYTYYDADGDIELFGATSFRWYRVDKVGDAKTLINGAVSKTYVLTAADAQKYIYFEVAPVAQTGLTQGASAMSDNVGQIKKE